ncbi:serine/threonine-protein kinase [Paenibacillus sp. OV219]|uniref:serine/threonine-protein kinase n=1 Tax=Paenibacillus sp. OV219 TaxID=1884377 RepID=UPI0008D0EE57|nr:serine/threonine-protein kinase [Paenibacillus sp. OV219]SEM84315.1 serine/threonine protein kinase [Paenibacillus sp. OV219]
MERNEHAIHSYEPGVIIGGRYRVIGRIGRGGMGEVYAAEDIRLQGKLRAVKMSLANVDHVSSSAEEAGLLMRLNHPHLPLIIDYFPPDQHGHELLVMDYIDGMTLQAYMAEHEGIIPAARAADIGIQLADALHYLHTRNPAIIHRDLKPTNVMIDRSGFVRLIDFGIAREYKPGKEQDTVQLGTPGFAAPEQEGEQQSDVRTDVFGLGALLYYLLSGGRKVAIDGDTPNSGSHQLSHVPRELAAVMNRMIDPNPSFRYSNVMEAQNALTKCFATLPVISDIRHEKTGSSRKQSIIIASLSPGAGGTFIALTLAHLLQARQIPCAAIEHPELEPEWHALLTQPAKQHTVALTVPMYRSFYSSTSRLLQWFVLEPAFLQSSLDSAMQYKLLNASISAPIQITDVSSKWTSQSLRTSDLELELIQCDMLVFIVDPAVSKWTPHRMKAAERISYERDQAGKETYWLANKTMKFRYRSEWISAIPKKPLCEIPMLPAEEWVQQQWSGSWATANRSWLPQLERALNPLIARIDKAR